MGNSFVAVSETPVPIIISGALRKRANDSQLNVPLFDFNGDGRISKDEEKSISNFLDDLDKGYTNYDIINDGKKMHKKLMRIRITIALVQLILF